MQEEKNAKKNFKMKFENNEIEKWKKEKEYYNRKIIPKNRRTNERVW